MRRLSVLGASTVTSVGYTLNTATTVKVRVASGGTWYSRTNTAGSVSCASTSVRGGGEFRQLPLVRWPG